jgi:flagellar secretion chaperone FliS
MSRPQQHYQRVEITTADPIRIVVLLYEGAIRNLNQACRLMGEDNETASMRISRALDILNYLRNALDHQKGGEIAANLERLYEYMRDLLSEANIRRDTDKIKEVITLLQTLLDGWRGIATSTDGVEPARVKRAPETLHPPDQPINLSLVG